MAISAGLHQPCEVDTRLQITAVCACRRCHATGLAVATERFVTCLIYCHDPVPRMTPAAVQHLRAELLEVDWAAQLKSSLLAAEYTRVS